MIHKSTVFVLGAGASMPYGFPSGAELRSMICRALIPDPAGNKRGQQIESLAGNGEPVTKFARAFAGSGIASIDAFVARRPEYARLGKLAISAILCGLESSNPILSDDTDDHWYRLLWGALVRDTREAMDIARSQVRFVTFNYDRSLEYFLFESISNSFGCDEKTAAQVLGNMGILHVYGQLGPFASSRKDGTRVYGAVELKDLSLAAASIHVVPEARSNDPFKIARKWFDEARRICFLGYGFDPLNNERLGLYSVLREKLGKGTFPTIHASTLDRTNAEIHADKVRTLGESSDWQTYDAKNSMVLRKSGLLLE